MSSNSWSRSGGTTAEESKPGGELYSIKRDGDHCCGVVELGRGRVTQQLTRQGRPIPRLQLAAYTPPPKVGLIHCDALSCLWGKMSTPSLPSLSLYIMAPLTQGSAFPAHSCWVNLWSADEARLGADAVDLRWQMGEFEGSWASWPAGLAGQSESCMCVLWCLDSHVKVNWRRWSKGASFERNLLSCC